MDGKTNRFRIDYARVGEISKTDIDLNGYELAAIILALGISFTLLALTPAIAAWLTG